MQTENTLTIFGRLTTFDLLLEAQMELRKNFIQINPDLLSTIDLKVEQIKHDYKKLENNQWQV